MFGLHGLGGHRRRNDRARDRRTGACGKPASGRRHHQVRGRSAGQQSQETGVFEEIRRAEARYLPYHIKKTLQGTGYWGAVRVIPSREVYTDVTVTGRSSARTASTSSCASRRRRDRAPNGFEREFETQTGVRSYDQGRDRTRDPYQKVFNDIANDMREFASTLTPQQVTRIRQVSEMQFFADMAPQAFGDYVATDENGMTSLVRLPAKNDPMVNRLRQIRGTRPAGHRHAQ
ncbi:MAG: hypothetical protein U5K76_08045 [Woeseiaceae bacterium]|nr:hypothetical protein [Woeseiaceae bacterium]